MRKFDLKQHDLEFLTQLCESDDKWQHEKDYTTTITNIPTMWGFKVFEIKPHWDRVFPHQDKLAEYVNI